MGIKLIFDSIYMNTSKSIILLVWVQRHPNIALDCRFQNQSKLKAEKSELQFQDMSGEAQLIIFSCLLVSSINFISK